MIGLKKVVDCRVSYLGYDGKDFWFESRCLDRVVRSRNLFYPLRFTEDSKYLIYPSAEETKKDIIERADGKTRLAESVLSYSNGFFATRSGFFDFTSGKYKHAGSLAIFSKGKDFLYKKGRYYYVNKSLVASWVLYRDPFDRAFKLKWMNRYGKIIGEPTSKVFEYFIDNIDFNKLYEFYKKAKPKSVYERGFFVNGGAIRHSISSFSDLVEAVIEAYNNRHLLAYYPDPAENDRSCPIYERLTLDLDSVHDNIEALVHVVKKMGYKFLYAFPSSTRGHWHVTFSLRRTLDEQQYLTAFIAVLDSLYSKGYLVDTASCATSFPLFLPYCPVFIK